MTDDAYDLDDVLNFGSQTAKWLAVGHKIGGQIIRRPKKYHAKEYDPRNPGGGRPKYFESGAPIMGVMVDVQTIERDPTSPDDDGTRRLYIESKRQIAALRDALKAAIPDPTARRLERHGWLWMTWTGEEQGQGATPAKTWAAEYRPPAQGITVDEMPTPPAVPQYSIPTANPHPTTTVNYGSQPVMTTSVQPVSVQQPMPPAPALVAPPVNPQVMLPQQTVITESIAAAMRNAGLPTDGFVIVPG